MSSIKFLKFWFPVFLYSAIIFGVSSLPNLQAPLGDLPIDKLAHVIEYMPFGIFVARALAKTKDGLRDKEILWWALLASLFYGISDEIHQMFVVGRTAAASDALADVVGGWLGAQVYFWYCRRATN